MSEGQYVDTWKGVIRDGPMALTDQLLDYLVPNLDAAGRHILRALVDDMNRQTKWIVERTEAMREEAERIALIGVTMRRAGLRSYTDEKARIFVADRAEQAKEEK